MQQPDFFPNQQDQYLTALICLRPDRKIGSMIGATTGLVYGLPVEKCTTSERLHLTLLYCPALHVAKLPALKKALARIRFNALDLSMLQPVAWNNGVAALLPVVQERVGELRDQVQLAAWRAGVLYNTHSPKTAHITVSREAREPMQLDCPLSVPWHCDGFELVHSPAYPAPYVPIATYRAAMTT